jgi:WD40 repeat protein
LSVPVGTIRFAVTPDGRRALFGQKEGRVAIYDLVGGKVHLQLDPHLDANQFYPSVAISPDGRWGLSAARVGPARLWDLRTGKLVQTLATLEPMDCTFSPDSKRVALVTRSKIDVWQLKTNTLIHSFSPASGAVKFTPDGRGLVSSGKVRLYRIADPQ